MRNSETDRLYRIALEGHCKITTACNMWNGHGMTCVARMNCYQHDVAAEAAARKAACEWESQRDKVAPVLTVDATRREV